MDRKKVTFLVASDRRGVVRRYVVSSAWLKTLSLFGIIIAVVGLAAFIDYIGLLAQSIENKRLRAENRQLRSQFEVVESKLANLEGGLERVKSFATKLELITGTDDENRTVKLALGPQPQATDNIEAFNEPMEERGPASFIGKEDSVFFEKAPLDVAVGELANEEHKDYASLSVRIEKAVKDTALREQGVLQLWESLSSRQSLLRSTPSMKPAMGWITSRFGYRMSPFSGKAALHQGVDIASAPGTPVYAPADGVVSYAGYDQGYGKLVSIDHGYGVVTRYGHNSQLFVVVGQKVKRGDVITATGSTGRSTGTHLHYEVRVNGLPVDPLNYILTE